MTTITLRPYLPGDSAALAELFRASVEALTEDDYDDDQRAAWMAAAEDEAAFAAKLARQLTLIALRDGALAGFISLKGADDLDMLYVAPEAAGEGVGAALCDALERLAQARGAKQR